LQLQPCREGNGNGGAVRVPRLRLYYYGRGKKRRLRWEGRNGHSAREQRGIVHGRFCPLSSYLFHTLGFILYDESSKGKSLITVHRFLPACFAHVNNILLVSKEKLYGKNLSQFH
jgi:hypothetical protein